MRVSRIFYSQKLADGDVISLDDKSSHYLTKVLRHRLNDPVILFNGKGGAFNGNIVSIEKKAVQVQVGNFTENNNMPKNQFNIAVSVCKGDKMDWLVQKTTELGVSSIQPLITEFTDVKLSSERWAKKCRHWQQIAISACEQSNRNLVPSIKPQTHYHLWLNALTDDKAWLFHPDGEKTLSSIDISSDPITLCFGPEGGFSEQEIDQATTKGIEILTLGPRILRAETAPLAVLAACQYR